MCSASAISSLEQPDAINSTTCRCRYVIAVLVSTSSMCMAAKLATPECRDHWPKGVFRAGSTVPAEARPRRLRLERARREVLDLPAPGPQLELAAAVHADPARGAVVVRLEQRAHASEPRRLHVQRA